MQCTVLPVHLQAHLKKQHCGISNNSVSAYTVGYYYSWRIGMELPRMKVWTVGQGNGLSSDSDLYAISFGINVVVRERGS